MDFFSLLLYNLSYDFFLGFLQKSKTATNGCGSSRSGWWTANEQLAIMLEKRMEAISVKKQKERIVLALRPCTWLFPFAFYMFGLCVSAWCLL
jgi:hypothetical protein